MDSVLDIVRKVAGEEILRDLEDELKGILNCIAHDNQSEDIKWIKNRQRYLNRKYGNFMNELNINFFGYPCTLIESAYGEFLSILETNQSPEEISNEAKDILGQYLELSYILDLDFEESKEVLNLSEVPNPNRGG